MPLPWGAPKIKHILNDREVWQSDVAFIVLFGIIKVMALTGTSRCLPVTQRAGGWCEPADRRTESIPELRAD